MMFFKKYFPALVFLFLFTGLHSQSGGYTFCDWEDIKFDPDYKPKETDTTIVFVSTRHYFPGKVEFLDYEFDTTHTLHYFNMYFNRNKWICVPKKTIEEAFENTVKSNDILVYVEGMGKTFPSNLDRATRVTRLYGVTTVMFDWPTYSPFMSGGKNYKVARMQSVEVSRSLGKLFSDLDRLRTSGVTGYVKMSLVLHSLGNRLIKDAVKRKHIGVNGKLFDNIILNAPCVSKRGHKKWMESMKIQREIYITRNNHDKTLVLAGIVALSKQMGRHFGLRKAENATYINFSKVLKREHNYFLMTNVLRAHPDIKLLYDDLFHGRNVSFDDPAKFKKRNKGKLIILREPHVSQDGDIGISIGK